MIGQIGICNIQKFFLYEREVISHDQRQIMHVSHQTHRYVIFTLCNDLF